MYRCDGMLTAAQAVTHTTTLSTPTHSPTTRQLLLLLFNFSLRSQKVNKQGGGHVSRASLRFAGEVGREEEEEEEKK